MLICLFFPLPPSCPWAPALPARQEDRAEALRIADIFRANVIDSTPATYTIEVTGDPKKIEAIINLLQPLGIKELTRTGRVAVAREPLRSTTTQPKKVARE